jgi:hypothetical protein
MNWPGWTAILTLIPIIWLVWIVREGTPVTNRFGHPPEPNSLSVKAITAISILTMAVSLIQFIFLITR